MVKKKKSLKNTQWKQFVEKLKCSPIGQPKQKKEKKKQADNLKKKVLD